MARSESQSEPLIVILMSDSAHQPIHLDVFSVRDFYAGVAEGDETQRGYLEALIPRYLPGIHSLPSAPAGRTLTLIDGAFGHSLRITGFLRALRDGELPRPVRSRAPSPIDSLFAHSSPGALARRKSSILAALDSTEELLKYADAATSILCPTCGFATTRFKTPIALIDTIVSNFSGSLVRISAIAPDEQLTEWAARHGFSMYPSTPGFQQVSLHQTVASSESLGQLATLMRSLWTLSDARVQCESDSDVRSYARYGWCSACNTAIPPVKSATLRTLLDGGLSHAEPAPHEALLVLDGGVTIAQLLCTPIVDLTLGRSTRFADALDLSIRAGLGNLTLGVNTEKLGAADLAALSMCRGLLDGTEAKRPTLIDLPDHIFSGPRFHKVNELLDRSAATIPVIISDTVTTPAIRSVGQERIRLPGPHIGTLSIKGEVPHRFELHLGRTLHIQREDLGGQCLFSALSEALRDSVSERSGTIEYSSHAPAQVHPIRIFPTRSSSQGILVEALGLGDRLAELYAASVDARSLGLRARNFSLGATRTNPHICSACKGFGVTFESAPALPRPLAAPCHLCRGLRCKAPVRDTLFRGISFSRMLNQTFREALPVLKALPKASNTLRLIEIFELQQLPLGMPVALLSDSEQRATNIVRAILHTTRTKPSILLIEEPELGLSPQQQAALSEVRGAWPEGEFITSIEVTER